MYTFTCRNLILKDLFLSLASWCIGLFEKQGRFAFSSFLLLQGSRARQLVLSSTARARLELVTSSSSSSSSSLHMSRARARARSASARRARARARALKPAIELELELTKNGRARLELDSLTPLDETSSTFIWLFDTFARSMSGKQSKTILIDQDATMKKALTVTWPNICHRLCIWHVYQNEATHLSSVFARFPSFSKDFSSCIYDFEEEEEFLCAWEEMLDKYELKTNEWLERMFKLKEKWAYGRQSFCADTTTTQCSESMISVFKRYVSYKYNLLQVFHYFERLIDERRYQELKAGLRTCHSTPVASFSVEILKHAASVYTLEVFELFQDELWKAYDSQIELCGEIGGIF
ncbi:UNVERIFIED_CONTAM: protein FAR1-RELATED SEQUENCE 3 [Sesamum angustifolium]|uniref:Protein FAR1-RELATED SEQUENCE n=1 Tax=Sesamum angustifolium TaxID=2727405 RepID=A0AAW2J457_9LAMI